MSALALLSCSAIATETVPGKPYHHRPGGGFRNLPGAPVPSGNVFDLIADRFRQAFIQTRSTVPDGHVVPEDGAVAALAAHAGADTITWIGHASVLIRLGGMTVLVDPVYSERVTPLPPLGPRRLVAPGIPMAALPQIDIVVVSHDHFDHLDLATLAALPGRAHISVVVPLGVGPLVRALGYSDVRELDWWERTEKGGVVIEALPASHYSGRSIFQHDRTLWAGYALRAQGRAIFVSGDTGYSAHFAEIGARAGPFDIAILNVGAYEPEVLGHAYHVTPEEAVQAARDIGAAEAIPVHWGTFALGREPPFEPGPRMARAAAQTSPTVRTMRIGETLELKAPRGP